MRDGSRGYAAGGESNAQSLEPCALLRQRRGRGHDAGELFRKETTGALYITTDKYTDAELPPNAGRTPGQIGECARVAAVDTMRAHSPDRPGHALLGRGHAQDQQRGRAVQVPRIELQKVVSGKKREKTVVASLHEKELNDVYTCTSLYI
jgi:hypothetical protein